MTCSVAIPSSPVFSPSRHHPLSCKGSPEPLTLGLTSPLQSPAAAAAKAAFSRSPLRPRVLTSNSSPPIPAPEAATSRLSSGGSSLLKRRRPARIEVPPPVAADAAEMGSDGREEVEEEGDGFSVYCKRGRRRLEMEDRHVAAPRLRAGNSQFAFFGVFDGHGGKNAAEFAAQNMPRLISEEIEKIGRNYSETEEAIRNGYLRTDAEFLKEESSGGACCVTALVRDGDLIVSNAGDCRAVLSRGGNAEALTSDHLASREDERERIENLGGLVVNHRGVWRLQGSLAVSRAIGNAHLKQWVIADPETKTLPVDRQCEFLVLASDGLWDKVSNQEAVDIARPLCVNTDEPSALSACKKLADLSSTRGSLDDISVMIILLQNVLHTDTIPCSSSS